MAIRKSKSLICALAIGCGVLTLVARPAARATTTTIAFGGSADDVPLAVAVDAYSNVYVAGSTRSRDLPGTQQAYQKQLRGFGDAFIAKFDPSNRLVWATYLGGSDSSADQFGSSGEQANAIGVDPQGNVYVAGSTTSADFPTLNAYQGSRRSTGLSTDGFLTKLDPSGGRLIYSTYLGAAQGSSRVSSISVGPAGDVWLGIAAPSSQFPVTRDLSTAGVGAGVIAQFQSSGMPVWLTRVGSASSQLGKMAVDPFGQPTMAIGNAVIQLDASGSHVNFTWSTPGATPGVIAVGADGTIAVVGSASEISVKNAWQPNRDPAGNGFLALLSSRGVPDVITYLPGANSGARSVAVDPSGGVHLAFDSEAPTLSPVGGAAPPHSGAPVFVSVDRGDSWTWASSGLYGGVSAMVIDAVRDYVYALASAGVFRSVDRGSTWSLWSTISGLSPLLTNAEIALDPRDPTTMYVGASDLWRIDQDGRSQTLLRRGGAGVAGFRVESLAVSPYDGSVWVGSGNGLEASFDRGLTWGHRDRGFFAFSDRVASTRRIVFDLHRPGTIYAQGEGNGEIYRSVDNGLNWQSVTTVLGFGILETFELDPGAADRIYIGTTRSGIMVTEDGGRSWNYVLPNSPNISTLTRVSSLVASPLPPYQVYATVQTGIVTSSDRGATWFAARHVDQRQVPNRLIVHPRDRDVVFSAASRVTANPFVMRMDRRNSGSYSQSSASVFPEGSVRAIAAGLDGQTVVVLSVGSSNNLQDTSVVRIGR